MVYQNPYPGSQKECHFSNSKSQHKLSLTNYICKIINIYKMKLIYYINKFYDESNMILM
jgi:hypothetical protein